MGVGVAVATADGSATLWTGVPMPWPPASSAVPSSVGACANGYASSDGRVVSVDHGCGAHSDVVSDASEAYLPDPVWDSVTVDSALFD